MNPLQRTPVPAGATACVLGGAVTRERLQQSATREGRSGSALVQSLLAQSLPSNDDLARAYRESGGVLRLDDSFLRPAAKATRFLDLELLRRERCVPVEILDDLVILAVEPSRASRAVEAVREALERAVLPVVADAGAIDLALADLQPAPRAIRRPATTRRDSAVHARFRDLVLDDGLLDALPLTEER